MGDPSFPQGDRARQQMGEINYSQFWNGESFVPLIVLIHSSIWLNCRNWNGPQQETDTYASQETPSLINTHFRHSW